MSTTCLVKGQIEIIEKLLKAGVTWKFIYKTTDFDENSFHELKKKLQQQIKPVRNPYQGVAQDGLNSRQWTVSGTIVIACLVLIIVSYAKLADHVRKKHDISVHIKP